MFVINLGKVLFPGVCLVFSDFGVDVVVESVDLWVRSVLLA